MGWVSGFVLPPPVGILHLDKVVVDLGGLSGAGAGGRLQRLRGMHGLGLLLGAAAVCHGAEAGCRRAELLAINDGPPTYGRLVRHYERLGFCAVREVGENGLSDLPHLLVWGGEGMRMDAEIKDLLEKWSPYLKAQARLGMEEAGGPQ